MLLVALIHRYVFRSAFITSVGAVLMFAFILLTGQIVKDILSLLAQGQLDLVDSISLLQKLLPFVFVYALPLGLLTGILLTMGRLSAENEITAMRAAGIGIFRLSASVLVFAVLGAALALVVNFHYGPIAKTEYRRELADIVEKNPLGFIVEKTPIRDFPGYVVYVSEKEGSILRDLYVWVLDDEKRAVKYMKGQWGEFKFLEEQNALELVLHEGSSEARSRENPEDFKGSNFADLISINFEATGFMVPLDAILGKVTFQKKLDWMTYNELTAQINQFERDVQAASGEAKSETLSRLSSAKMAFHEKFAMGFSVLSFAILGIPMGIRSQRSETSANLFLAIGLALFYYILMMAVGWLDGMYAYQPHLLYWLPNIIYQGAGMWMLFRSDNGSRRRAAISTEKAKVQM